MKRALFAAAASTLGALGTAGLMMAAPASAVCGTPTTPPAERVSCLVNADLTEFASSTNPANQINTFLNGTVDPDTGLNDGLGILDQPKTFTDSLKDFASGPVSSAAP